MKIKTFATVTAALMLAAGAARAAHIWEDSSAWWDGHFAYDKEAPKYAAEELSLDLFGSYLNRENEFNDLFDTNIRHGFWGGGVGVNYFITRNLGLESDFNISSKPSDQELLDYWVGNIVLRLPIGNTGLAPYIYGGGGRSISPAWHWIYGGGVGLEYRFNPSTGIFSDARFLWDNETSVLNRLVIRAGVRLTF